MSGPQLPRLRRPALFGPSRKARWRRWALRRAAAIGCAAAAVLLLVAVVRPPPPASVPVVVAARTLPAGTPLSAGDLTVVQLPAEPAPVAVMAEPTGLIGRQLAVGVERGEPVTTGRLVPRGAADGLEPGTVAAHVGVTEPGALALVSVGRRVTLYADVGGPALARDVLVLAVDTPETATFTGSLPGEVGAVPGIVVALPEAAVEHIFAGQRPDGTARRVIPVVTG